MPKRKRDESVDSVEKESQAFILTYLDAQGNETQVPLSTATPKTRLRFFNFVAEKVDRDFVQKFVDLCCHFYAPSDQTAQKIKSYSIVDVDTSNEAHTLVGVISFMDKIYTSRAVEFFNGFRGITWIQPQSTHDAVETVERLISTGRYPVWNMGYFQHAGGRKKEIEKHDPVMSNLEELDSGKDFDAIHTALYSKSMVQSLRQLKTAQSIYHDQVDINKNQKYKRRAARWFKNVGLYPWQGQMFNFMEGPVHPRKVFWIHDKKGNVGKTEWCKRYSDLRYKDTYYGSSCKTDRDLLHNIKHAGLAEVRVILLDFSRVDKDTISYSVLERLKNARWSSDKYRGGSHKDFHPHIVAMANFLPRIEDTLSADRWLLGEITDVSAEILWSGVRMDEDDDWVIVRDQGVLDLYKEEVARVTVETDSDEDGDSAAEDEVPVPASQPLQSSQDSARCEQKDDGASHNTQKESTPAESDGSQFHAPSAEATDDDTNAGTSQGVQGLSFNIQDEQQKDQLSQPSVPSTQASSGDNIELNRSDSDGSTSSNNSYSTGSAEQSQMYEVVSDDEDVIPSSQVADLDNVPSSQVEEEQINNLLQHCAQGYSEWQNSMIRS